ncbi:hypothetical protein BN439_3925 [Erwinia amylovora Ea644]|uniref:Uncharacterized protein n=3 Tax=Erwinia amylovora TaxID=552 RepID=A0A831A271_ERWAM|nr:hypothetical protein EaACW_3708 [Erwinia amylovora ACW56400]CBA24141.1 hypothetical protein predicted by Glimmer/Critica [Erwinia amylovora CFBP1430]CBX82566.1 hypothetical protein predicted by Glimmer/Critica [Erwinia amylovora ATCC BAA-2158]CCO80541.1 hypothetical protein BN432_3774 [Erwinia amylovora Ea356]CCO84354.1 hypothetical protein BN433_3810 [Erwinia amylovora Ea266]CCO88107.1 hypothetical protein BN434_3750 [Erwinia amylovora CFBP 2585]CCO91900.1 hypothetical protein BN435_3760 
MILADMQKITLKMGNKISQADLFILIHPDYAE